MLCTPCRFNLPTASSAMRTSGLLYYRLLHTSESASSIHTGGGFSTSHAPAVESNPPAKRPKLHWTEEFKIRSPKVPASLLETEPVVAIDINSDAFVDRRIAFVLRRRPFTGPLNPRLRGVGKILSLCAVSSLPYLLFCKWAGGTPLLGDMATYAIPATVAGVSLGYLGINLALERAVFRRRIFSIALDEVDPQLVYISTLPIGGWLHGSMRSYVTRLDNIFVELPKSGGIGSRRGWAKLRFKAGSDADLDWLWLPVSRGKCFVADSNAMSAFAEACGGLFSPASSSAGRGGTDLKRGYDTITLPSEADIDRHLEASLTGVEGKASESDAGVGSSKENASQVRSGAAT